MQLVRNKETRLSVYDHSKYGTEFNITCFESTAFHLHVQAAESLHRVSAVRNQQWIKYFPSLLPESGIIPFNSTGISINMLLKWAFESN